jgi:hypothetical protein
MNRFANHTVDQLRELEAEAHRKADDAANVARQHAKGTEKRRAMHVKFIKQMDLVYDVEQELKRRGLEPVEA